mmetsp:Transcript_19296/g.47342  ORF Transcript_19296/g.47342 Transcript_19296/m.47342 type:complete len:224 (+) Transcript_19296:180-851(+)
MVRRHEKLGHAVQQVRNALPQAEPVVHPLGASRHPLVIARAVGRGSVVEDGVHLGGDSIRACGSLKLVRRCRPVLCGFGRLGRQHPVLRAPARRPHALAPHPVLLLGPPHKRARRIPAHSNRRRLRGNGRCLGAPARPDAHVRAHRLELVLDVEAPPPVLVVPPPPQHLGPLRPFQPKVPVKRRSHRPLPRPLPRLSPHHLLVAREELRRRIPPPLVDLALHL